MGGISRVGMGVVGWGVGAGAGAGVGFGVGFGGGGTHSVAIRASCE